MLSKRQVSAAPGRADGLKADVRHPPERLVCGEDERWVVPVLHRQRELLKACTAVPAFVTPDFLVL